MMCDQSYRHAGRGAGRGLGWLAVVLGALWLAAGARGAPGQDPLPVVATTGMIADAAREIGGARVRVEALMGEGVDPHLYKASPRDVRKMADAGLVLHNGLHLEGRMGEAIERMAQRTRVVRVTERLDEGALRRPPEFEGQFDPHVWFDVSMWSRVGERVRDALIDADGAGREEYERGAAAYAALLASLHGYARDAIATIPESRRIMVTAHDAFGYFGRAYGIEVRAIQGISTDSEASLRDVNALVEVLVTRRVPAVFVESSVPRKTIDALVEGCRSRGHEVAVGGQLFSDAMGKDGTPEGTYVGMVAHNVETIVRALGGTSPARPALVAEYLSRHGAKTP